MPDAGTRTTTPTTAASSSNFERIRSTFIPPVRPPSLAGVWPRMGRRGKGPLRRPLIPLADTSFLLGGDVDQVAQGTQPGKCLPLELSHPLARQVELVPDRLERPRLALEPEPQLEDAPLTLRKRVERAPHALPA